MTKPVGGQLLLLDSSRGYEPLFRQLLVHRE
jgi:hypothetical protein